MSIVGDYKLKWAKEQMKDSDHPLDFWMQVIEMAIDGRKTLQADQLNPLGNRVDQKHWQDYLAIVLQTGIEVEKAKGMDNAFVMYEICIAELFNDDRPYDLLRAWYQKRQWHKDAMRVAVKRLRAMEAAGEVLPKTSFSGFVIDRTPVQKKSKK
jgi:hypothetical protein